MTDRERFEAWISAPPYCLCVARYHEDNSHPWAGRYIGPRVQRTWDAWREGKGLPELAQFAWEAKSAAQKNRTD